MRILRVMLAALVLGAASWGMHSAEGAALIAGDDPKVGGGGVG